MNSSTISWAEITKWVNARKGKPIYSSWKGNGWRQEAVNEKLPVWF